MSKKEFVGWEAEDEDGNKYREGQIEWKRVPKKNLVRLSLFHYGGRRWDIVGKEAYFVRTKASVVPGVPESFRVEERIIGYYEGASKVCYMVDEITGGFRLGVING
jgi:hypothetical protein